MNGLSAYGLWSLVLLNSAIFIAFAFSFARPQTTRDWRSFGAYSAFIVALFTEMYGFPLTIYLLSGWLSSHFPGVDWLSHDAGHLLEMIFGWEANPHFGPFHLLSIGFIVAGFWLLAKAWPVLYEAQRERRIADTGPYAYIRHPQYVGFVAIMFGFLLQWPTIPTLVMFPVLVWFYSRLARREEAEMIAAFGDDYRKYAEKTPAFIPWFGRPSQPREPRALHGASGAHVGAVSG
jgi:protein-S-isoprenylcysteine O-methyltransferase Ste14